MGKYLSLNKVCAGSHNIETQDVAGLMSVIIQRGKTLIIVDKNALKNAKSILIIYQMP